jgi:hypothetical protein
MSTTTEIYDGDLLAAAARAFGGRARLRLSVHVVRNEPGATFEVARYDGCGWRVVARAASRPALLLKLIEIRRAKELERHKQWALYGR